MTSFEVQRLTLTATTVKAWSMLDPLHTNWPVVYVLDNAHRSGVAPDEVNDVYVGESINAGSRMRQHLDSREKHHLGNVRVIVDKTFNKSVCLDLESYLIRMLAGDGLFRVLNRNDGIVDADYFDRERYRSTFREVFDELRSEGLFTRTIPEIENSDLFKLSPFKALSTDQAIAVEDILEGLFADLRTTARSTIVVQGDPGTGKTVVAIFLLKLLIDIANTTTAEDLDSDSMFSEFFVEGYRELLDGLRIGFVVPQQSLRNSIKRVFRKTPGLDPGMVLTPFDVGQSEAEFDLLVVDEAHRLNQRANQPSGVQNKYFREITEKLFGFDDSSKTQLDWIRAKSKHQVFLLDADQSVRPADLPPEALKSLIAEARSTNRHFPLVSQMRVMAGADYIGHVRRMLAGSLPTDLPIESPFGDYDFRMFDDVDGMRRAIQQRDTEVGLARMVAGYAWEWRSKNAPDSFDIEIDGHQFRWNSTATDWIASSKSVDEVGSIHTVQGYDLNYAGVIIGGDLRFDAASRRPYVDRSSYFDKKGKENNPVLGRVYTDDDLLRFVTNIYAVLMTRGIRGTYVYVVDPALREYLRQFIPTST